MPIKYLDPQVLLDDGYLQEVNRGFFHPLGLALEVNVHDGQMRVWDYREDPEGIAFEESADLTAKAKRVAEIREERRPAREKALGYWQQPA